MFFTKIVETIMVMIISHSFYNANFPYNHSRSFFFLIIILLKEAKRPSCLHTTVDGICQMYKPSKPVFSKLFFKKEIMKIIALL